MKIKNWKLISTLILIIGFTRLLPHPPNFSAFGAMALFGGAMLSNRFLRYLLPLSALFISDLIINNTLFYNTNEGFTLFYDGAIYTYIAFAIVITIAPLLIKYLSFKNILIGSLTSSLIFFIVSNFGVWSTGLMYPQTLNGLASTYFFGLPFFGNTITGDLFFNAVLFGGYYLAETKLKSPVEKSKL